MNDCHYYFDSSMSLPFDHTLLISGMNFCPYLGEYKLPFNEGSFIIEYFKVKVKLRWLLRVLEECILISILT